MHRERAARGNELIDYHQIAAGPARRTEHSLPTDHQVVGSVSRELDAIEALEVGLGIGEPGVEHLARAVEGDRNGCPPPRHRAEARGAIAAVVERHGNADRAGAPVHLHQIGLAITVDVRELVYASQAIWNA